MSTVLAAAAKFSCGRAAALVVKLNPPSGMTFLKELSRVGGSSLSGELLGSSATLAIIRLQIHTIVRFRTVGNCRCSFPVALQLWG